MDALIETQRVWIIVIDGYSSWSTRFLLMFSIMSLGRERESISLDLQVGESSMLI